MRFMGMSTTTYNAWSKSKIHTKRLKRVEDVDQRKITVGWRINSVMANSYIYIYIFIYTYWFFNR
jgi:uncharacterized membrane protein